MHRELIEDYGELQAKVKNVMSVKKDDLKGLEDDLRTFIDDLEMNQVNT